MSTEHHGGKGYAPLPQCVSNSDTEEDDERLTQLNEVHQKEHEDQTEMEQTVVHGNGTYYPLDETRNLANRARNGQHSLKYYRDDIPIMIIEGDTSDNLWKRRDMSPLRRFCLVSSILLCLITIVVFLYILPCDDTMVCPPVVERQSSISWDKTVEGVELHGPISVIPGTPYNLIFLLRGQRYGGNNTKDGAQQQISSEGSGVISLQGNTGIPLWWVSLKRSPTDIDCSTIDTDLSGKPDCIVVGEHGLLASIEPTAGTIHWSSAYHTFPKLPVILPDINSDNVEDLLTVEIAIEQQPNLVLISGRNGQLLGKYNNPGNCSEVDIYKLSSNKTVAFTCRGTDGKNVTKYVSYQDVLTNTNMIQGQPKVDLKSLPSAHLFPVSMLHNNKNSWNLTPHHQLAVENVGPCHEDHCSVYVNLTLQKSKNQTLLVWDHVSPNSMATRPVFLTSGKPYTTGFAIKFWQWTDYTPEYTTDTLIEKKLVERVLIVVVNYTDVQVINASQSDVIQLCRDNDCQPNPLLRTESSALALAYFNNDELPQLINYWSSYSAGSSKMLTSKVQVVKMDSVVLNFLRGNHV